MSLTNSKECEAYLRNIWKNIEHQERVYVVFLNSEGVRLDYKRIDKGKLNTCDVDFQFIVKTALNKRYHFVVLAHNHPIGEATPSQFDINTTERLVTILKAMDITLIDHIILAKHDYFSFKDSGLIESKFASAS